MLMNTVGLYSNRTDLLIKLTGKVLLHTSGSGLTLSFGGDVHAVLDLHVPTQVALQVELTGAVRALKGLAARVEVHVAQQVVHSVESLTAHLRAKQ